MQLKIYQENAIGELIEKANKLIEYTGPKKMVFKSPTGSGKTIMTAEFLKQFVSNDKLRIPYSFIWTAPRKLHIQSKDKLEKYYEISRTLKCSFFEELDDRMINENEILFFNWESVNKRDNVYIRDNEQDFNLSRVLEKTRDEGNKIILIIDESHHHATSDNSQGLIEMINPKLTIEVSATPVLNDPDEMVSINIEDVKNEGMIKKAVILNDDFSNIIKKDKIQTQKLSGGSEELVLDIALKKRQELADSYKKEKANINPLVLIQLPDRVTSLQDRVRERVERILKDKHNISIEKGNNKLAIWLSGEHINKEYVERNESDIKVLIFKQAIALGWDCPRAQILVLFREWHSSIFSIQTVGRIMRMPEPDKGHYETELLNYGYVFTNLENIEVHEDIAKSYIVIYTSKRRKGYKPINLLSCYPKRMRERTRLSPLFIKLFLEETKKYDLAHKIKTGDEKINYKIISDYTAENIDELTGVEIVGDKEIELSGFDLQRLFDFFIKQNLTPFYPEDRSVSRVKEAIYKFFKAGLGIDYRDKWENIIRVVLSEKNSQHIINVLSKSKERYESETAKRDEGLLFVENWNVPKSLSFGKEYFEEDFKKSIMQPFFNDRKYKTESKFIDFLEKSDSIEWWFKNGSRDATFFAVPYNNGKDKPFYVDFIVKLKDERIGLFDTKAGLTKEVAGPKIDGINKYIKDEKKKGKNLFGGIVTNTDDRNYRGRWVLYEKTSKKFKNDSYDNWSDLII